jgi:hypothetical protein
MQVFLQRLGVHEKEPKKTFCINILAVEPKQDNQKSFSPSQFGHKLLPLLLQAFQHN